MDPLNDVPILPWKLRPKWPDIPYAMTILPDAAAWPP
jgi:hypothetical protein